MHFLALATDYDGTLATHGKVFDSTNSALKRLRASGRRTIMVTGRELPELQRIFPELDLFDAVAAENGALLYWPGDGRERRLGEPPPPEFIEETRRRGVSPFSIGRVIFATWEPHQSTVLQIIHDLGLEYQIIFNKGAVMVLPTGINKAVGLLAALEEMSLLPENTVAIGDAENDHALLKACGCGAAVANALPSLKQAADLVTQGDHGAGVEELIEHLLRTDLGDVECRRRSAGK